MNWSNTTRACRLTERCGAELIIIIIIIIIILLYIIKYLTLIKNFWNLFKAALQKTCEITQRSTRRLIITAPPPQKTPKSDNMSIKLLQFFNDCFILTMIYIS